MKKKIFYLCLALALIIQACTFTKNLYNKSTDALQNLNVFPYTQDIELGKKLRDDILSKKDKFPVMKRQNHREIYNYIESLRDQLLETGKLKYRNAFEWEVYLVKDDKTLNAFVSPGGYIFIYSGLIKYLDSEDQLLGVLAHEMAHADRRHSTRQLTRTLGVQILLEAVIGDQGSINQILGALVGLKFSRSHEAEADKYSVEYLCHLDHKSDGCAGFFMKMQNQPTPPEFLSTHPSPKNRIKKIQDYAEQQQCSGTLRNQAKYERMKKLL